MRCPRLRRFDPALLARGLHRDVTAQVAVASDVFAELGVSGAARVLHVASVDGLGGEESGPPPPDVASSLRGWV